MYFSEFESYGAHREADAPFVIHVTLREGPDVVSSPVPGVHHSQVLSDIAEMMDVKGPWFQWDRRAESVTAIPYELIRKITLRPAGPQ